MKSDPDLPLCICHHFSDQHDTLHRNGVPVVNPPCLIEGCKCQGFQPVSHKSGHVYQRGTRTGMKRIDQLHAGDWVLVHYNLGIGLVVAPVKADALLAQVLTGSVREEPAPLNRFRPQSWIWNVSTDLGGLGPYIGNTLTMIAKEVRR